MNENPLIKVSLILLNIVGFHPVNQNIWSKGRAIATTTSYGFLTIEVLMELILNWKGLDSISALALFTAMYQVLSKMFALVINLKKIKNVLRTMDDFWHTNNSDDCKEIQDEIIILYDSTGRVMYFQIVLTFFSTIIIMSLPIILHIVELPVKTYHPTDLHKTSNYGIMYAFQYFIALSSAVYFVLGFDCLFTTFIVSIYCEFKIIKAKMQLIFVNTELNEEANLEYLKRIIHYHDLLLCFIRDINEIYSMIMLNQFVSGSICIYISLAAMVINGFPIKIPMFTKLMFVSCLFFSHLFTYSIGGTILIDQCESMSDAIFDLDWYTKTQPKVRKTLILILQRCQRVQKLTAGGIFDLKLKILTDIAKIGFLWLVVMQAVLSKRNNS